MKKLIYILIFILFPISLTYGQELEHTINAANFLQQGNLTEAEKEIGLALSSPDEKEKPYTWYINSFLLKEKYKSNNEINSLSRDEAIEATNMVMKYDVNNEYGDKTYKIIEFLSSTYLKDAFDMTKSTDTLVIVDAINYYQKYENSKKVITPNENFMVERHDVYIYIANRFEKLYNEDRTNKSLINNAIKYHEMVLEENPEEYRSNYNISVDYYNQAVEEVSKIDASTPFWELIYIQETTVSVFQKSLPYMLEANRQKPNRINTLRGLMAIHNALNDEEKFLNYQAKLEEQIIKQK